MAAASISFDQLEEGYSTCLHLEDLCPLSDSLSMMLGLAQSLPENWCLLHGDCSPLTTRAVHWLEDRRHTHQRMRILTQWNCRLTSG
jgi:hypothetical protein